MLANLNNQDQLYKFIKKRLVHVYIHTYYSGTQILEVCVYMYISMYIVRAFAFTYGLFDY